MFMSHKSPPALGDAVWCSEHRVLSYQLLKLIEIGNIILPLLALRQAFDKECFYSSDPTNSKTAEFWFRAYVRKVRNNFEAFKLSPWLATASEDERVRRFLEGIKEADRNTGGYYFKKMWKANAYDDLKIFAPLIRELARALPPLVTSLGQALIEVAGSDLVEAAPLDILDLNDHEADLVF